MWCPTQRTAIPLPPRRRTRGPTLLSHYIAKMYDVAADGRQMVGILENDSAAQTHLRLILNFGDEVRRRLAGGAR